MRKTIFANGEHYHIYNRGVDKREIFSDTKDYKRFLLSMNLLNDNSEGLMIEWRDFKKCNTKASLEDFLKPGFRKRTRLVEIVAYCLNPNHYHFILKQVSDKGIEKFMHKIGISHTKHYNDKYKRSGSLFQGSYKAITIDSNEYLLHLSAYVNTNNFIHEYSDNNDWEYSSLPDYLGKRNSDIVTKNIILDQLKNINDYSLYLKTSAQYFKDKKELREYIIEE